MSPAIISIDWGGTKARAAVVNESNLIRRFTTKSANLRLLNSAQLKNMVIELSNLSAVTQPAIWLVGAAGAGDKKAAKLLESTLLETLTGGSEVHIYSDYLCNHAAAFGGNDGILCVNGTGSVIFARYNHGMVKSGGLGYVLDRAPSGAYFGRKALQLMLDTNASVREEFCSFANNLGLPHSAEALLSQLYCNEEPQRFLGKFAAILTRAYDSQNHTARTIVASSFDHMVEQLLSCEPEGKNLPICPFGGLWDGWPKMTDIFKQRLQSANLSLNIVEAQFSSDLGPLLYYKKSTDFTARLAAQLKSQEQA